MDVQCPNPLKDVDCQRIDQLLQSCAGTSALLEKLASCGLEVAEWKQRNDDQQQFATKLKAAFFPGRP